LVRTHDCDPPERFKVCELGEITAPAELDGVGLDLATSQRILCDVQHAVVTVQERALKDKSALMRQVDPTFSLKDYRRRSVQTLFGTLKIRVPRRVRRGSRLAPPCLFRNSARSNTEYDELRSRLGALMSYRMAERLVGDLFPFAVGRASSTTRRQVLRSATHLDAGSGGCAFGDRQTAASIDLGIDTTFIRSNTAQSPRHHEILIGVGANDQGKVVKASVVLSASDKPHSLIEQALHDLGQADATRVTAFTDGDQMLRGYLKKAGVAADPILHWQHGSRRVQIAQTTAKGLGCLTNAERRPSSPRRWRAFTGDFGMATLTERVRRWHGFSNCFSHLPSTVPAPQPLSPPNGCKPRWANCEITSRGRAPIWWTMACAIGKGNRSVRRRPKDWQIP
jgi:hypothetical protein